MDLIAGPQGSGKSSFFPVADRGYDHFNIDDHRRKLNGGSSQDIPDDLRRRALKDYEQFIETHIERGVSFSIEVTLAKDITFEQACRARDAGFRIQLTYIAADVELCVERVEIRVDGGGHGVDNKVIRDTHAASMKNLRRALAEFDVVQVYDNSRRIGPSANTGTRPARLLEAVDGQITYREKPMPGWLAAALAGSPFADD